MDLLEKFKSKIEQNYNQYIVNIKRLKKADIINKAAEISEMQQLYKEFSHPEYFDVCHIRYLLQFKNPLNLMFDSIIYCDVDRMDAIRWRLWYIVDKGDYDELITDEDSEL